MNLCQFETVGDNQHQCRQCGFIITLAQQADMIFRECSTAPVEAAPAVKAVVTTEQVAECNCNKKRRNIRQ